MLRSIKLLKASLKINAFPIDVYIMHVRNCLAKVVVLSHLHNTPVCAVCILVPVDNIKQAEPNLNLGPGPGLVWSYIESGGLLNQTNCFLFDFIVDYESRPIGIERPLYMNIEHSKLGKYT